MRSLVRCFSELRVFGLGELGASVIEPAKRTQQTQQKELADSLNVFLSHVEGSHEGACSRDS